MPPDLLPRKYFPRSHRINLNIGLNCTCSQHFSELLLLLLKKKAFLWNCFVPNHFIKSNRAIPFLLYLICRGLFCVWQGGSLSEDFKSCKSCLHVSILRCLGQDIWKKSGFRKAQNHHFVPAGLPQGEPKSSMGKWYWERNSQNWNHRLIYVQLNWHWCSKI